MKSKFAGLAEARMKAMQSEALGEGSAEPAEPKPQKRSVKTSGNPDAGRPRKPAVGKPGKPAGTVSLSINVPEEKRRWWNIQALLHGTTVTDAVIEALDKRFGLPKKVRLE